MTTDDTVMLQSIDPGAGTAGPLRAPRPRRAWILAAAGMCLAVLMMSASPGLAAGKNKNSPKYWKGKNIAQATKKFGDPTQMTPLTQTGGNLYIFAHEGEQHWVFETDPGGKIVKAARIE
jgi:hypothetical protein